MEWVYFKNWDFSCFMVSHSVCGCGCGCGFHLGWSWCIMGNDDNIEVEKDAQH